MADTTSLKLPEDIKDRVGKIASRVEQTPHAYMVQAIAEKLERDEKRQEFLESARRSQENFHRTGIAYAYEDVKRYIVAKAAGKKVRKPKPIRIPKSER